MTTHANADDRTASVFFTGLAIATVATAIAALPAAFRASAAGASLVTAWLGLWGAGALLIGPSAGALRVARPLSRLAWAVPLGFAIAAGPLLIFARVLKVATHHRPLGGATFAFVALALLAGAIAVSARLLVWSETSKNGRILTIVTAVGSGALALLLGSAVLAPALRGSALDALLAIGAIGAGAFAGARRATNETKADALERFSTRVGPVVWLVSVGLGIALVSKDLAKLLGETAPVLLGLLGWIRAQ